VKVPCPACKHLVAPPALLAPNQPDLRCPSCGKTFALPDDADLPFDDGLDDLFQSPDDLFPPTPEAPLYLPDLDALPPPRPRDLVSELRPSDLFSTMDEVQLGAPAPPLKPPRKAPPIGATPRPPLARPLPQGPPSPDLRELAAAPPTARVSHSGTTRPSDHAPKDHQRAGRIIWTMLALLIVGGGAYIGYVAWSHDGNISLDVLRTHVESNVESGLDTASNLGEVVSEVATDIDLDKLDLGDSDYYEKRVEVRNGKKVIVMVPRQSAIDRDAKTRGGLVVGPDGKAHSADGAGNAPELRVREIDGRTFDLADHRGETVVLNMYATWCGPCRQEMPDVSRLNRWASEQKPPVKVYGVVFQSGTPEAAAATSRKLGVDYPILVGDDAVAAAWGVRGFPTTVVVDRDGNIAQRLSGSAHFAQLQQLVKSVHTR